MSESFTFTSLKVRRNSFESKSNIANLCSSETITTPTFYDECHKVDFWFSGMMSTNTLPRPASFGIRCKIRKTFWSKPTRNFLQFGFEKMQSFSGALSQLNFWSKKLSPSQMKALAQCSGEQIIHSNNTWNITKLLSEGKNWAHYFIECWLTRPSINQNWTTSINTFPGQGIDKNIDGAHKFEDIITAGCSIPFHLASHQCFVFYDLWKWVNFSRVEFHWRDRAFYPWRFGRHCFDFLCNRFSLIAKRTVVIRVNHWCKECPWWIYESNSSYLTMIIPFNPQIVTN